MKVGASVVSEVATGGDPEAAVAQIAQDWTAGERYVLDVAVRHDDGCPCLRGRPVRACTCEILRLEGTRVA